MMNKMIKNNLIGKLKNMVFYKYSFGSKMIIKIKILEN